MAESTQKKLDRVRPPRVQITYDVETGGGTQKKELPFVVGVIADLSGKPESPLPKLKDRKFVDVDRDNFDQVMEGMKPRLAFTVDNRLQDNGTRIGVELRFKAMEDFEPQQVVAQVEPLRKLLEAREKLAQLLARVDGNDKAQDVLEGILQDSEKLKQVRREAEARRATK